MKDYKYFVISLSFLIIILIMIKTNIFGIIKNSVTSSVSVVNTTTPDPSILQPVTTPDTSTLQPVTTPVINSISFDFSLSLSQNEIESNKNQLIIGFSKIFNVDQKNIIIVYKQQNYLKNLSYDNNKFYNTDSNIIISIIIINIDNNNIFTNILNDLNNQYDDIINEIKSYVPILINENIIINNVQTIVYKTTSPPITTLGPETTLGSETIYTPITEAPTTTLTPEISYIAIGWDNNPVKNVQSTTMTISYDGKRWFNCVSGSNLFGTGLSLIKFKSKWIATGSINKYTYANNLSTDLGGVMGYSYDGISWIKSDTGTSIFSGSSIFSDIKYTTVFDATIGKDENDNDIIIAVGGQSVNGIAYSYDGINWEIQPGNAVDIFKFGSTSDTNWGAITSCRYLKINGINTWVATGYGPSYMLAYSNNLKNWNGVSLTGISSINSINTGKDDLNQNIFVIACRKTDSYCVIMYSYDGINWLNSTINTIVKIRPMNITFGKDIGGNNMWLCSFYDYNWILDNNKGYYVPLNDLLIYSLDGKNWNNFAEGNFNSVFYKGGIVNIKWNEDYWIATGNGLNMIAKSKDGMYWIPMLSASDSNDGNIFSVYGNGNFVEVNKYIPFSSSTSNSLSSTCDQGYYNNNNLCIPCGLGTFSDSNNPNTCKSCNAGSYSNNLASFNCVSCNKGTYSSNNFGECIQCNSGYYSQNDGSTSCTACESDTFSNQSGSVSCKSCEPGTFSGTGSTGCSVLL